MDTRAKQPTIVIMVETIWESMIKVSLRALMVVALAAVLRAADFPSSFAVGIVVVPLAVLIAEAAARTGLFPGMQVMSSPPEDLSRLVDSLLENENEDEDDETN